MLSVARAGGAAAALALLGAVGLLALGLVLGAAVPHHAKYAVLLAAAGLFGAIALRRVEIVFVALLFVAVLARAQLGSGIWTAVEIASIVLILIVELGRARRPIFPPFLAVYCAWFLVATIHVTTSLSVLRSRG